MISRRSLAALALGAPALLRHRARASSRPHVTFINPGRKGETFWIMAEQTMAAAASALSIELEVLQADRSRHRMRDLGLSVAARATRPDALVIANEEQSAREVVLAAGKAGLPTLLVVTDLAGADAEEIGAPRTRVPTLLGSITPDNVAAGRVLAGAVLNAARGAGAPASGIGLLAIAGDQITSSSLDRVEGLKAALKDAPDAVLSRLVYGNWSGEEAKTLTMRHLDWARRSALPPSAVWAASDAMALGAASAFAEAGWQVGRQAVFGGVNWSREAVEAVAEGRMAVTLGGHFLSGAWAMVMLRDHFDGQGFEQDGSARLRAPLSPISRDSAGGYLEAFGSGDWSRIDYCRFCRGLGGRERYDFSLAALLSAANAS